MSSPRYRVTPMAPGYDLGAFDCDEPAYNQWLTESALNADKAGTSKVHLLLEETPTGAGGTTRVVGYYAICTTSVRREDTPKSIGHGSPPQVPGYLLTKLALDASMRGDKDAQWGNQLLREALETVVRAADLAGARVIVVDADNAGLVPWYARAGFKPTREGDLRLYIKVSTARKYLKP